jgi:hypothetical protein
MVSEERRDLDGRVLNGVEADLNSQLDLESEARLGT